MKHHQKRKQKSQWMDSFERIPDIPTFTIRTTQALTLTLSIQLALTLTLSQRERERATIVCSLISPLGTKYPEGGKLYEGSLEKNCDECNLEKKHLSSITQNSKPSKKLRYTLASTSSYREDVTVSAPFVSRYKNVEDTSTEVLRISPERYKSLLRVEEKKPYSLG